MGSATSTPTFQAVNANIANDGSANSPRGWAIATDANYTFSSTGPSRVRCSGMTAAKTVTLPTTGIKAGAEFEVIVSGATEANYVALNSSGANEVDRIGGSGKIVVVALQDTPTTAGHWAVVDVWETGVAISATLTGAIPSTAYTYRLSRNNDVVTIFLPGWSVAGNSTINTVTTGVSIPTRFRNTSNVTERQQYGYRGVSAGVAVNTLRFGVKYDGTISWLLDDSAFPSSSSTHSCYTASFTYSKTL
jgi:hypothetical protein